LEFPGLLINDLLVDSSLNVCHAAVLFPQAEYSKGLLTQAVEIVQAAGAVYLGAAGNWQGTAFEVLAAKWSRDAANGNRNLLNFGTDTSLEIRVTGQNTIFALHVSSWFRFRVHIMEFLGAVAWRPSQPTAADIRTDTSLDYRVTRQRMMCVLHVNVWR
jgi:hypothetical protein